jgi:hypothetical protein
MSSQSFSAALSDAEMQMATGGFSTSIWVPEFGWSPAELEASEDPHEPQMLAAMQCFLYFFVAQTQRAWVHLAAEMQAGKTGVVTALIRLMLANARLLHITPDRMFVITGMSDNAWLKQTKNRLPLGVRNGVQHSGGLPKIIAALHSLAAGSILSNVLIVLDESHIASSTGNRPGMVYAEVARLCPRERWDECNIRFLTISATDPAKGVVMSDTGCPIAARVVRLQTSKDYQSVETLSMAGRIRPTQNLVVSGKANATAVAQLKRVVGSFTRFLYHIVRPSHGKQAQACAVLTEAFPGCDVIPWDSGSRPETSDDTSSAKMDDINELLEVAPERHTFILLKNMFYASKTMDDTHVGVLYDRVGGKDDTNLQSLLGRACGYGKSKETIVFSSEQTVTNYLGFWREVIAGGPPPLTDIPVSRLDKKMAGQRVQAARAGVAHEMPVERNYATPAGGGGGSMTAAQPKVREKKNEDDYHAVWHECSSFEAARAKAKGIHTPTLKDGFYLTSTTKGPEVLRYDQVMLMKGGKKTANLPKTEVGKTVNRLYVGYKNIADPASAVFVVRSVTRLR